MREFMKSMLSFSWGISLFGLKQLENMLTPKGSHQQQDTTVTAFDAVTHTTIDQLGGVIRSAFEAGDKLQRGVLDMLFNALPMGQSSPANSATGASDPANTGTSPSTQGSVDSGRLNTTTFITLGEGLAAGMGDLTLSEDTQRGSFPAQMAGQMQAHFPQPLIQAPGIGHAIGFAHLPVRLPAYMQTTVLDQLPPTPPANLAIPGCTLFDALNLRPAQPLVHRNDAKQTAINLILGVLPMVRGEEGPLPTQLEVALQRSPTFTVIELGYYEVLEAAVKGDPGLLPEVSAFRSDYTHMLTSLKESGTELLVLTVPDPIDTAHFSPIDLAAKLLKVEPAFLLDTYGLKPDALMTVPGLMQVGYQLFGNVIERLPEDVILRAEVANQIRSYVGELNEELIAVAQAHDALVYDLHAFFRRVAHEGIVVGARRLTVEFLGGFYALNGYYPGATGHALIANELLHLLNNTYGANFPPIDVQAVSLTDPVADYRQAEGPNWTFNALFPLQHQPLPEPVSPLPAVSVTPPRAATERAPAPQEAFGPTTTPSQELLQLPPGLEQVLPLSRAASYFGDGIAALNCRSEHDIQWGSCANLLFGGFALVDSHLSGAVRIKFSPPSNHTCDFDVYYEGGFVGEDSVLTTPQFFKMPFQHNRVDAVPGMVSSGKLDLRTGEAVLGPGGVPLLHFYATYTSNALFALASVNPRFPLLPGSRDKAGPIAFPGQYGSARVKFEPRPDGLLDFTFYGSTFVPLGSLSRDIRWPLPIAGPTQQYATIPAKGTVMHPHLHLSTKPPEEPMGQEDLPAIPFNTVQELTLYTHNSSFGDAFHLDIAQLGGSATGRSHVLGRVQIQFGEPSGDSVPIAISHLNPGGVMAPFSDSPISDVFPGRLPFGPQGFDELLMFPQRIYSLDDLTILDDPFDIAVGAVNLKTGKLIAELLHRGFINQDLIFALLRVEPRTPKDSFFFRGPAWLEKGTDGQLIFRFKGEVFVPYPGGLKFPQPNLTTSFTVNRDSRLDPFLWIRAIHDGEAGQCVKEGRASDVVSSTGERFSYSYVIPGVPTHHKASFEYENHTQKGTFRMYSLAWVGFSHSMGSQTRYGEYDTVTFTGFGIWSKDGVKSIQQAAVQISTSPQTPYVGIQIDSGFVSNVNTKPENIADALP